MEQRDFEELLSQIRQVAGVLKTAFNDATGEDLDMESAVRHYPLLALAVAAGAGTLAGFLIGRRQRAALPTPSQPQLPTSESPPAAAPSSGGPFDFLEEYIPAVDRMRKAMPDEMAEDAAQAVRTWADTVLEPKLKQGLDTATTNFNESRFGSFIRQAVKRADAGEEVHLEDPPEGEADKPRA